MASALSAKHFHNEEAAYAYVEARLWPEGPVCPHCGGVERISKMGGKSTRIGTYKCYQCRRPFTVKIGTIFEASHVPLNVWLQAMYLIAGSKKGISSNQLHRTLGVTLKTAWFMSHRIREAMRSGDLTPFGSGGGIVEADETFIGRIEGRTAKQGYHHKYKILALVDRDSGRSRAFVIDRVHALAIAPIILKNMDREARLFTDEATAYSAFSLTFADHQRVRHGAGEYESIPTPSKAISRSSSAGCAASISGAARSTFTATLPSTISAIQTVRRTGSTMPLAQTFCCVVSWGGVSPIKRLVEGPDSAEEAKARKRGKAGRTLPKRGPKVNRRWRTKPHRGR